MVLVTIEIPQLLMDTVNAPIMQVVQSNILVVAPRMVPMVLLFSRPQKLPSCQWTRWSVPLFCRACRSSTFLS